MADPSNEYRFTITDARMTLGVSEVCETLWTSVEPAAGNAASFYTGIGAQLASVSPWWLQPEPKSPPPTKTEWESVLILDIYDSLTDFTDLTVEFQPEKPIPEPSPTQSPEGLVALVHEIDPVPFHGSGSRAKTALLPSSTEKLLNYFMEGTLAPPERHAAPKHGVDPVRFTLRMGPSVPAAVDSAVTSRTPRRLIDPSSFVSTSSPAREAYAHQDMFCMRAGQASPKSHTYILNGSLQMCGRHHTPANRPEQYERQRVASKSFRRAFNNHVREASPSRTTPSHTNSTSVEGSICSLDAGPLPLEVLAPVGPDVRGSASTMHRDSSCHYTGHACHKPRAIKLNGLLHQLCGEHRLRTNDRQLRSRQQKQARASRASTADSTGSNSVDSGSGISTIGAAAAPTRLPDSLSDGGSVTLASQRNAPVPSQQVHCMYPGRPCMRPRARKLRGDLHRFCDDHRLKENAAQKKKTQSTITIPHCGAVAGSGVAIP